VYERYCKSLNVPVGTKITIPFLPTEISMISLYLDNDYNMFFGNISIKSTSSGLTIDCPNIYKASNSSLGFNKILFRLAIDGADGITYPIRFYGNFARLTNELSFLLMLANHPEMYP
jgi:hypothetical protein